MYVIICKKIEKKLDEFGNTLYYHNYSKLNMVIISLIQSGGEIRLDEVTATPYIWKVPTGASNRTIRGFGLNYQVRLLRACFIK